MGRQRDGGPTRCPHVQVVYAQHAVNRGEIMADGVEPDMSGTPSISTCTNLAHQAPAADSRISVATSNEAADRSASSRW